MFTPSQPTQGFLQRELKFCEMMPVFSWRHHVGVPGGNDSVVSRPEDFFFCIYTNNTIIGN